MRTKLTVAQYIELLRALPQDVQVYRAWEGELLHPHPPELVTVNTWKDAPKDASAHHSVNYYPELEADEDYIQSKGVVLS